MPITTITATGQTRPLSSTKTMLDPASLINSIPWRPVNTLTATCIRRACSKFRSEIDLWTERGQITVQFSRHSLTLELTCESSPFHDRLRSHKKHLTRCLRNRLPASYCNCLSDESLLPMRDIVPRRPSSRALRMCAPTRLSKFRAIRSVGGVNCVHIA